MSETTIAGPIEQVVVEAPKAATPSAINMPDHEVRTTRWYQIYVRLARPTLDWATIAWFLWCCIIEPAFRRHFDIVAVGMCLAWCAAIYGIKTYEKQKGVA
ncbi:hypothetical protein [Sphingomonas montanisoli]|uniref:Uncharacterized protein n=1 Tax=Sphingomonas montanisoli TaxID=2606412 RepID=A0A5D9BYJ0_9SPHN|nr:hypothetical protein [Sphingomonas montanisoli]TZG23967.1 hypothetical protein FYJ91_20415 [Sphingomonas montanisoli]